MPNKAPVRDDAATPDRHYLDFKNGGKATEQGVEEYYPDGAKPSERPQEDARAKTNYSEK
jgi:hypothetical protein